MYKRGNIRICCKLAGKKSQRTLKIFVFKGKKNKIIEKIGFVTPSYLTEDKSTLIGINFKRLKYWYSKGASFSPRFAKLFVSITKSIKND